MQYIYFNPYSVVLVTDRIPPTIEEGPSSPDGKSVWYFISDEEIKLRCKASGTPTPR